MDWEILTTPSLWLFGPKTPSAEQWAEASICEDAIRDAHGRYAVEPRYALPLVHGLVQEAGFTVSIDGREVVEVARA